MFSSRPAARIALIYLAVALPWVLFTDLAVRTFSPSVEIENVLASVKGTGFVVATTVLLFVLLHRQFGALMAARDKAEADERFLETLVGSLDDAVFAFDRDLRFTYVAGPLVSDPKVAVGATAADLLGADVSAMYMDAGRRALAGETVSVDWFPRVTPPLQGVGVDSKVTAMRIVVSPLRDAEGEIIGGIGVARDISQVKDLEREWAMAEDRLSFLVSYDDLTGLPNRALMESRLREAIIMAEQRGELAAVHYLDLDDFKDVNDSLGHGVGDVILQTVASRLRRLVRRSDTVARMGGDEFAVIQTGIWERSDVAEMAGRINALFASPFQVGEGEVFLASSNGIAVFPSDGETAEALYRAADTAMYAAKRSPEQSFEFYTPAMSEAARERLELGSDLQRALESDAIQMALQPVVSSANGRIVAFEALARWEHPTRGWVSPATFIPLAETMGLIRQVDTAVHRQALRWLRTCRDQGFEDVSLHVNVSSVHLRGGAVPALRLDVAELGIPPARVVVEVTESVLLDPLGIGLSTLQGIREAGFQLAVDDFGTGYSSLSYLKQLPLTMLKIDTSFIDDLDDDRGRALVETTVELARRMGYTVVQEGVETEAQRAFVEGCGVDAWQGFLKSRPVTGDEALTLLAAERAIVTE